MATLAKLAVRCPVYRDAASRGFATGCGSTDIKRVSASSVMDFLCNTCGLSFGSSQVEYDRKVLNTPTLRAAHDARIAGARYV